jgi:hypothetical protein
LSFPKVLNSMALKPETSRFSLMMLLEGVITLTPKFDKRPQLTSNKDTNNTGMISLRVFILAPLGGRVVCGLIISYLSHIQINLEGLTSICQQPEKVFTHMRQNPAAFAGNELFSTQRDDFLEQTGCRGCTKRRVKE